jgi:anti-sigma regulatory factor (Ser/Thr protein kinase)
MALSTLTLAPQSSSAATLRAWLRTVLAEEGIPKRASEEIVQAAEEALNAAILHGASGEEITITLSTVGLDIYLTVSDSGTGLHDERLADKQTDIGDDTTDLGLLLVRGLMDEVTLRSTAEGTVIRLVKHLRRPVSA